MACSIVISSVSGTTVGTALASIHVTGTVTGCNQVDVTIRCGATTATQTATISGSSWSVVFDSNHIGACQCNQNITVSATCVGTAGCSANAQPHILECMPCCDVQISPTVGPVCDNGQRFVTFQIVNNCPATVTVQFDFGDGSPILSIPIAAGAINTQGRLYFPGTHVATLHIPNCPNKPVTFTVDPCPECCNVQLSTTVDPNCHNGKRTVTLHIVNNCPAPINAQCDFGDGSSILVSLAPGNNNVTHIYGPGSHSAVLHIPGCPGKPTTFTVPPCCCPEIKTEVKVGECDDSGKTKVCLTTNAAVPAGCEVTLQWDFGDGQIGGSHTFAPGSNTFIECHDYGPGSYTAHLNIVSPSGCSPAPVHMNVPPCDCCPDIRVDPCIEDCDIDGNRLVKFKIDVSAKPAPCPTVQVQMDFGDGSTGGSHTFPPGGSGSYTETHTYTGSAALQDNTAALNVIQPQGCPGWSKVIRKCCTPKRRNWCGILFYIMTGTLAFALVLLLLKLLCSVPIPQSVIIALVGLFIVALLVYLLLKCPKCRCGWLYLLLWRVLFGVGTLLSIFSGCHPPIGSTATVPQCNHWTFWIGLGLLLLGIACLLLWKRKCCVKTCVFLAEIILWVGTIILPLAGIINNYPWGHDCLYVLFTIPFINFVVTFYALVLILWAFVLAWFVSKCIKH